MNKRLPVIAAALAVTALFLSACGNTNPGAAAVVGSDRISEQELASAVETILTAQGHPVDTSNDKLTRETLDRMVKMSLIDDAATRAGVVVTQGEIDATLQQYIAQAGDEQTFHGILLGQGIAPSQADAAVKLNLQAQKLAQAISPGADQQTAGMQLVATLGQYSESIGTTISPRYGTWDAQTLSIGGLPSDLSVPLAG